MKSLFKRYTSKGQAMFIITLALPVIIGVLTIVMDVGNLYYNQVSMQVAVDSGVLSGALYLPSYPSQAVSVAEDYAERNGIKASEIVSCTVSPDNKTVLMSTTRNLPCFFCAVLGEGTAHADTAPSLETSSGTGVKASASALIVPIKAATGVVPLGVDYRTDLSFGNVVQLKQGQVGAGNWDPLALGGTGADNYRSNVQSGYPGKVSAGDMLLTEPGDVVGPTTQAIQYRISMGQNQFSTGTFQNHDLNDPRVMLIPIVDFSNINGSSQVPMKGFAMMWISSIDGNGTITCYFIQQSVPNAQPDPTGSASSGATTPILK
ncbi:MAG TPA: Tad domain-containing protein [Candidatus Binataceae bacterium]|nr:Tad domain-containing protein [Candidatus Binataceae bacterium]